MLSKIRIKDSDRIKDIILSSVHGSVTKKKREAKKLIEMILESLENWRKAGSLGFHRKYTIGNDIVGFIIVKEYWNLSQIFVSPDFQGKGIGRSLITAAIRGCRDKSPKDKLMLNSSTKAAGFYKVMGFRRTGPGKKLPGGCIPFEYDF